MNQKNHLKEITKNQLVSKKIVIFGAGFFSIEFYNTYRARLNIVRVVSNIKSEWGEKNFQNELNIEKFSRENIKKDEYIVICGPYAFEQIEPQLLRDGFKMFYDFVDYRIVPTVLYEKKIALFRGSCVLRDIYNEIIKDSEFNEKYEAIFVMDNYTSHKFSKRIVYYSTVICDLYLYSYRILAQDKVHIISKEELPDDCIMLSVSNISFGGFWPQTDLHEYNDNMLVSYNVVRNGFYYHMTYGDNDNNINRLMEDGKSWEEIYDILSDTNFYSEKEVNKTFRMGMKSIEMAEKGVDIVVGDYIKDNYLDVRLFQDTIHTNKFIIGEFKKRIYEALNIEYKNYNEYIKKGYEYVHHGGDRPIYPSVYRRLGLKWVDDDFEYEIMTYYGIVKMTFKEYIKHYVEYNKAAIDVRRMWEL